MKPAPNAICQQEMLAAVSKEMGLETYIETGTFQGENLEWAEAQFTWSVSIDADHALWSENRDRFQYSSRLDLRLGDYAEQLQQAVSELKTPTLFRLDDHWHPEAKAHNAGIPRLSAELDVINRVTLPHAVAVDDIHLFLAPPPGVDYPEQWPTLYDVLERLAGGSYRRYVLVICNMAIAVPVELAPWLAHYAQGLDLKRLEQRAWQDQTDPLLVGFVLIKRGIAQRKNRLRNNLALRRRLNALLPGRRRDRR